MHGHTHPCRTEGSFLFRRTQHEAVAHDVQLAVSAVFRSELSVFLLVQWFFSAYAVFALGTVVSVLDRMIVMQGPGTHELTCTLSSR